MEKVPLFNTFKDMKQGFERMLSIAETIKNDDAKIEMIVCYGCLIETFNEHNRTILETQCELAEEFVEVKDEFIMKKGGEP